MLIDDIATRLISHGGFTAIGTDVFLTGKAKIPAGAGPLVQVTGTGGPGQVRRQTERYGRPSATITVRASGSTAARTAAAAAMSALDFANVTIGSTTYLWVRPVQSEPYELPEDVEGRARFGFSVETMSAA